MLGRAPNPGVTSKAWTLLSLWPAKPLPCWEPLHQTCPCPDRRLAPEEGVGPSWASFSGGLLTLPKSSGVLAGKAPQRGPLQDLVLSPTLDANRPQSYRLRQMDTWRAWGFPAGWLLRHLARPLHSLHHTSGSGTSDPRELKVPEIRPCWLSSHGMANPQLCLAHDKSQQINLEECLLSKGTFNSDDYFV